MANITFDSFLPFGQLFSLFRNNIKGAYRFSQNIIHGSTQFNNVGSDQEKIVTVLSSPAVLKVFALQCDLFSMGLVGVKDDKENPIEDDPFLSMLRRPNPFQSQSQFLWDFMFWHMMGVNYCYVNSSVIDEGNVMYFLNPSKMEWPRELEMQRDKLVFSKKTIDERGKLAITYRYDDGSSVKLPLNRIIVSNDLTNGLGNWYKGPSRLDALYKIVSNSEFTLDAKNINVRYSGKFLVGSPSDLNRVGLGDQEKKDIENKIDTDEKQVFAVGSAVNIKRFVSDFKSLELGKSFLEDYFLIGSMYNIPRDVLEAYNSATYENQEKARAAHVNYCLDPKGNQFMDAFEVFFGYDLEGKNICITWDHLPFMQVFEKERVDVKKAKIETFKMMVDMGIPVEDANAFLETDFNPKEPQEIQNDDGQQDQGDGEAEDQQGSDQGNSEDEGDGNQEQ